MNEDAGHFRRSTSTGHAHWAFPALYDPSLEHYSLRREHHCCHFHCFRCHLLANRVESFPRKTDGDWRNRSLHYYAMDGLHNSVVTFSPLATGIQGIARKLFVQLQSEVVNQLFGHVHEIINSNPFIGFVRRGVIQGSSSNSKNFVNSTGLRDEAHVC